MLEGKRLAFALTYLAYAAFYVTRKNFSAAKYSIERHEGVSLLELGAVDSAYLLAYTLGQIPMGVLVDTVGAKAVLVGGLAGCGACAWMFSAAGPPTTAWWALCFGLNGLFQCAGPAGALKVMAVWFSGPALATAMGWWSTNYQVGGVAASALAGYLVQQYGWRAAFQVPGGVMFAVAAVLAALLVEGPPAAAKDAAAAAAPADKPGTAMRALLRNPATWMWGGAYFFLKLIRYSFLFWLPFYLRTGFGFDDQVASLTSTALEIGGCCGTVAIGYVCDYVGPGRRTRVCTASMGALGLILLAYPALCTSATVVPLLFCIGATLYAPDSLIVGCVSQTLGGPDGAASACGLINSAGSLGAFVQGAATPVFVERYGWTHLFALYGVLSLVAAGILMIPLPAADRAAPAGRGEKEK